MEGDAPGEGSRERAGGDGGTACDGSDRAAHVSCPRGLRGKLGGSSVHLASEGGPHLHLQPWTLLGPEPQPCSSARGGWRVAAVIAFLDECQRPMWPQGRGRWSLSLDGPELRVCGPY